MYDLAIIGAGAAGIAGAKFALKCGLKTALIESDRSSFGGICLNSGCIPTKFFLNRSKLNKSWEDSFKEKESVVEKIKTSLFNFLENQGVDVYWGEAQFLDKKTLNVKGVKVKAENIIIATGSIPKSILQHPKVIFSQDLFNQKKLPDKILIIGAGYIGIELASLMQNLGKTVYVVEKEKRILPNFDFHLANRLKIILEKKGIGIDTGKDVFDCNLDDFDMIISAVGRKPNIAKLRLEAVGLFCDAQGWIKTDRFMRTNIENIYACGDVNGKHLLAYAGEYQARLAIKNIRGDLSEEDYQGLPECVFSLPAIAKVGILEEEAKKNNLKYKIIKSNFLKFSSAYVYNDLDGFIEVLVNEEERIIGAGIISQAAGELINIFSLGIRNNLKLGDLKKCLFIHPTFSEIIPLLVLES